MFHGLLVPLNLIPILVVLVHNWLRKDNAVGFEISPKVRWTYKEDYKEC